MDVHKVMEMLGNLDKAYSGHDYDQLLAHKIHLFADGSGHISRSFYKPVVLTSYDDYVMSFEPDELEIIVEHTDMFLRLAKEYRRG